jgi:hypothetical protein
VRGVDLLDGQEAGVAKVKIAGHSSSSHELNFSKFSRIREADERGMKRTESP